MLKNKKILSLLAIILIILIVGAIMLFTKGMNYSLTYGKNTSIELYLETDFQFSDVESIITEIFGRNFKTRQVNNLDRDILIITKSVSDEQLSNLVSKINERYGLELENDDLLVTNSARISGLDIIRPYIIPTCITAVIILAYFIVRYKELGILNVILFTICVIIIVQLLLLSIYAITRIPINEYTMPISIILYIMSIIILTEKFERNLTKLKKEQN